MEATPILLLLGKLRGRHLTFFIHDPSDSMKECEGSNKFPIPTGNLAGLNDTPPLGSRDVDDVVMSQVGTRHCRCAMRERMRKIQGVGCSNLSAHSFNFYLTLLHQVLPKALSTELILDEGNRGN